MDSESFWLFRLLGYRFSPRLADIGGARFWRIDPLADYGKLNVLAKNRINLDKITPFGHGHINMLGRYSFALPEEVKSGGIEATKRDK